MTRQRDRREYQALQYLTQRRIASAIDLGTAAVAGEARLARLREREWLGLKLGMHFVKRGFARVDRFNKFQWVPPTK